MTRDLPCVDVVVLTWNDGALLDAAVSSAIASDGVDVRIVVVDNGSTPPAVAGTDPRVELVRSGHNLGVAAGRNLGVRAGRAPYVCLLDSDARLEPGCLRAMVGAVSSDPRVGMTVPVFSGQRADETAGRAPTFSRKLLRLANLRDGYVPTEHRAMPHWDVDFGIGACQLFRRAAYNDVGGIDERYFYGPEDVDFCLRARRAGWRVVQVAGARCHHPPRRRNRGMLTRRGIAHAGAVMRHLWRHRDFARSA